MIHQARFEIATHGRETRDITARVDAIVDAAGVRRGICQVFLPHTSASLLLTENADPDVRRDLETYMRHAVPDGAEYFTHTTEGPDDMAAHVRNVLASPSLSVPVAAGRCALGVWQGIYLWEHRIEPHRRTVVVTVYGEGE
jgi:secondary thiamine-phosphate synthase enzyme